MSKIRKAVQRFFADEKLPNFGYPEIELSAAEDALELCAVLRENLDHPERAAKLLRAFQPEEPSEEVIQILRGKGTPLLLELEPNLDMEDARLFLLKMLALYATAEGTDRVIALSKAGYSPDSYLWSVIFGVYVQEHPHSEHLFAALSSSLPTGFAAIALLDAANQFAISGGEFVHPFDSQQGREMLCQWLSDADSENISYAVSAAAALPFINTPVRDELLQLAMDHPDSGVSLEAAWAAAKIGMERGVRELARFAKTVNTASRAIHYLSELGRGDAIPREAQDPTFQAMAEMVNWLSHPNEFGEPPARITLYDTRDLFWPPTNDRRTVWLFRYEYLKSEHRDEDDVGLGMTGSVTFALFGETTAAHAPLEAYALHCCWELERNEDPRAPQNRSIPAGLKLLKEYNDLPEITEAELTLPSSNFEAGTQAASRSKDPRVNFFAELMEKLEEKRLEGDSSKKALRAATRKVMEAHIEKLKKQVDEFREHLAKQRSSAPKLSIVARPGSTDVLRRPEVLSQRTALESAGYQLEGVIEFENLAGFALVHFAHLEDRTVASISCSSKEITTELAAEYPEGNSFYVRDSAEKCGITPPPWATYRYEPGRNVSELFAIFRSARPPAHIIKSGAAAARDIEADFRRTQLWRVERGGWNRDEVQQQMGVKDPIAQEDRLTETCMNIREKWLFAWFKENVPGLAAVLLKDLLIVHDELDSSVLFFLWIMGGGSATLLTDQFEGESPRIAFAKVNEAQGSHLRLIARKESGYPADYYASELALAMSVEINK